MSARLTKIIIIFIKVIIILLAILLAPIIIRFLFNFGTYVGIFIRNLYKIVVF